MAGPVGKALKWRDKLEEMKGFLTGLAHKLPHCQTSFTAEWFWWFGLKTQWKKSFQTAVICLETGASYYPWTFRDRMSKVTQFLLTLLHWDLPYLIPSQLVLLTKIPEILRWRMTRSRPLLMCGDNVSVESCACQRELKFSVLTSAASEHSIGHWFQFLAPGKALEIMADFFSLERWFTAFIGPWTLRESDACYGPSS